MFKFERHFTLLDKICLEVDKAIRTVFGEPETTDRPYPAKDKFDAGLTVNQRKHSAGLMRVNHAGEVCAQALYHSQSLFSSSDDIKKHMHQAAIEEGDHLAWCQKRLLELGSHTSYLNPLWYAGSFMIGLTAGLVGDKWNLGFVAETENQVIKHLHNHLSLLPEEDEKSYLVLKQMSVDETQHRDQAMEAGAAFLPAPVKTLMKFTSKVMVKVAYFI